MLLCSINKYRFPLQEAVTPFAKENTFSYLHPELPAEAAPRPHQEGLRQNFTPRDKKVVATIRHHHLPPTIISTELLLHKILEGLCARGKHISYGPGSHLETGPGRCGGRGHYRRRSVRRLTQSGRLTESLQQNIQPVEHRIHDKRNRSRYLERYTHKKARVGEAESQEVGTNGVGKDRETFFDWRPTA